MKLNRPAYLLILLIEECAEIIQRACKCIRFGMDEKQPGQELANWERLQAEMVDYVAVNDLLIVEGLIKFPGDDDRAAEAREAKREKIKKYMVYSQGLRILIQEPLNIIKAGTVLDKRTMVSGMEIICNDCQTVIFLTDKNRYRTHFNNGQACDYWRSFTLFKDFVI